MAYEKKKTFMFGAMGFLLALSIIALLPMLTPLAQAGTLNIKITDAPADLRHLNMTIDSFEVRNKVGGWSEIPLNGGSISFDLLQLDGVTLDAATGNLDPGNYTMVRLRVKDGLEYTNATLTGDNEIIPLQVPSEKFRVNVRFEIKAGETTIVILDIQVDTITIANNPDHNLKPMIKAIVIPPSPP